MSTLFIPQQFMESQTKKSLHSQYPLSKKLASPLSFVFSVIDSAAPQTVFFKLGFHFTKLYWGEPIKKGVSIFFVLFDDTLDI